MNHQNTEATGSSGVSLPREPGRATRRQLENCADLAEEGTALGARARAAVDLARTGDRVHQLSVPRVSPKKETGG